ncbi:MAG: hypothetical protein IPO40_18725 [Fibrobacteres bacterium]|nr:hypothetical protein [Fibrobacterota bacterium]
MSLPLLPLPHDIESKVVLKKAARAHQALAELKGVVASIPNQTILEKDNDYLNTARFDLLHGAGSRLSGAST